MCVCYRQPQDYTVFDLRQFCSSSVCCLCAITDQLFIDLFLWADGVHALSGLWWQLEQVSWSLMHEKTFQCTGRRYCCLMLLYEYVTSQCSTRHSVLIVHILTVRVSVKPCWTNAARHDSASLRTLQHSALSPQQPDQYYEKETDGMDTPSSVLLRGFN